MSNEEPHVRLVVDGRIARITLSNPVRRNAITKGMWLQLTDIAHAVAANRELRVAVICGEGTTAFASGADISEFGESRRSADQADAYHQAIQKALDAIGGISFPVVAQIHGYCVGAGTAIALACDLRYGDDAMRFGIPAAKLGIGYSPEWIRRLAAIVGEATAAEILMSAKLFDARKAERCGFVNEIAPADELAAFVEEQITILARNAPLSQAAAKTCLREIAAFDNARNWADAHHAAEACALSRDYQNALAAFANKQTPEFVGE
ncbi:enoyl-CoA hydratase-related protein [Xanthobacter sp. TB0139]|uniref:enoyl-CoA hydratase-related protein n=1 Tax=Xanthobacter sp. TB0139 TaxID=3459178 RepID=UPI004039C29C